MLLRVAIFHYRMGEKQGGGGGEERRKLSVHAFHAALLQVACDI
jgi:hypothetical protein